MMEKPVSMRDLLAAFDIVAPHIEVTDLVLDSREVAIHKGFVAIKGHQLDGRDFIPQAISLGAKVILCETDNTAEHGQMDMREQSLIIRFYQLSERLSELAVAFYGDPASRMDIIAVTGTNGKTSTVQLCTQLRHYLGQPSASIGTLGAGLYLQDEDNQGLQQTLNTTPDALQMLRLLANFDHEGARQVALEASSHALVQGRISQLKTDIAVFTNLSRDHLDYHGSMSEYARAKRLLLNQPGLKYAVLNADDAESVNWLANLPAHVQPVLFSTKGDMDVPPTARYLRATNIEFTGEGLVFSVDSSWGQARIETPLIGQFNVYNLMAAVCVNLLNGFGLEAVAGACLKLKPVAGRMELFHHPRDVSLVVDYAHTPDALAQALDAASHHCKGQIWCIFGCGGDRDKGKRSLMGEVAERHSDHIVVTNDNSRSEEPQHIVEDILSGCIHPERVRIQLDRKSAIKEALLDARPGDLILVAGKGHEDYQIIGGQTLPYNEREYVTNLVKGNMQ